MKTVVNRTLPLMVLIGIQTLLNAQSQVTLFDKQVFDVIKTIPTPAANCQGLTWDGTHLWVSDIMKDSIYKIDTADGNIIHQIPTTPTNHLFEGLAWDGEAIWASHCKQMTITEPKISKLNPENGTVLHSVNLTIPNCWPHGITYDGADIWVSEFNQHKIFKVNKETGAVIDTIDAPGNNGNIGLTWFQGYLFSNDNQTDSVYQINPFTKQVVDQWFCHYTNPRDMAFDGEFLWFIAWEQKKIYKLQIDATFTGIAHHHDNPILVLNQNYPNPFHSTTIISWTTAIGSRQTLRIFDIYGNEVATLTDEFKPRGSYEIELSDRNINIDLPAGILFYQLSNNGYQTTRKMIHIR